MKKAKNSKTEEMITISTRKQFKAYLKKNNLWNAVFENIDIARTKKKAKASKK